MAAQSRVASQAPLNHRTKLATASAATLALIGAWSATGAFVAAPLGSHLRSRLPDEDRRRTARNSGADPEADFSSAAGVAAAATMAMLAARAACSFAVAVPLRVASTKAGRGATVVRAAAGGYGSSGGSVSSGSSSFMGSSMAGRVTGASSAAPSTSAGAGLSSMSMMFERFNEKAIKAVMMAQEESRRLGHNYVGTEMLLVGVVADAAGPSAKVLRKLNVTLKDTRKTVEEMVGRGSGMVSVEIPFTPAAKRVLSDGVEEARKLNSNTIDTAHILLALIKEDNGNAVKILEKLGVDTSKVPEEITKELSEKAMAKIAQAMASEQELIIESKSWQSFLVCCPSAASEKVAVAALTAAPDKCVCVLCMLEWRAALGLAERDSILRAMSMVMQLKGMSLSEWFEACALLDSYCLKVPVRIELLPAICVSIVRIVRKLHTATCEDRSEWLPYTQQLTHWLAFLGYAIPEMTEQFLRRHEMGLLKELGWQVEIPSIEGWIKMATARFNVLSHG
ncbi:unnamed protein product, partial [Polarella glacialis]